MTGFTRIAALAALALALAAPAARAEDEIDAATQEKVTAQLTAEGYEVRKIEAEDGLIEAYVVKDGKAMSLFLDESLKVVKTEE
jgi:hypothetical protein